MLNIHLCFCCHDFWVNDDNFSSATESLLIFYTKPTEAQSVRVIFSPLIGLPIRSPVEMECSPLPYSITMPDI
ncbi:hypothetical protein EB796_011387 [Bugula neritina]|uniref:Uncharacterized protein n=1 Tax=Bugula neritina TaxID=10212 RepID=A0A7J7JWH9_BUGNE|nr:hypothetical protein EB796_011387 [Bugula neritina]